MSLFKEYPTLESITEQVGDKFVDDLNNYVDRVIDAIGSDTLTRDQDFKKFGYKRDLEDLVWDRFGIPVELHTGNDIMAVLPVTPYSTSILDRLPNVIKKEKKNLGKISERFRELTQQLANTPIKIDLKNAKVKGLNKKQKSLLFINFNELFSVSNMAGGKSGLSTSMITAAIIHEIGHIFTALYKLGRTAKTNEILMEAIERNRNNGELTKNTEIAYILKSSLDDNKMAKELEDSANNDTSFVFSYKALGVILDDLNTLTLTRGNVSTNNESLADQFATRFGVGVNLVDFLNFYESIAWSPVTEAASPSIVDGLIWFIKFYLLSMFITILNPIIGVIFFNYILYIKLVSFFHNTFKSIESRETYDNLPYRYKRIRDTYVNILKDSVLPSNKVKEIISHIYRVDDIMSSVAKDEYTVPNTVITEMIGSSNRAKQEILKERLLEGLANNDLFLKAAELNNI